MAYFATTVNYDHLVCGILLLLVCGFTAVHIYKGSRAEFAVTLVAFSTGFALYDIVGGYFCRVFTYNFYLTESSNFTYYLLYVQSWLIAMKYLHSAMQSSAQPLMDP